MDIKECFNKKLLKRIAIDANKIANSIKIAENKLLRANELFGSGFFSDCLINAYTFMFHSARALLYKEGIQEKSHYAVYICLNEKFKEKLGADLIESFFNYQLERHEALYGFDSEITKDKAEGILEDAKKFLNKAGDLVI